MSKWINHNEKGIRCVLPPGVVKLNLYGDEGHGTLRWEKTPELSMSISFKIPGWLGILEKFWVQILVMVTQYCGCI